MSVLLVCAAYVLGSFPTSQVVAKIGGGVDLRERGSGNVGATNLFRVLGWRYAVPAALIDVLKGTVPVVTFPGVAGNAQRWYPLAVGIAAVLGHVFSVFLKFRGGKGVATAAGVILGLAPKALGLAAIVWVAVLAGTGYVSVASMLGAVAFPVAVLVTAPQDRLILGSGVVLAAFILFTHRSNIKRLLAGTENKIRRRQGSSAT